MDRLAEVNFYQDCRLVKDRPVLVGVSGGTDSLALLHLLVHNGYSVIAAHFNHHLRPDAGEDAKFVEASARQFGCQFVGGEDDIAALAAKEKLSLEAAARKARYQFLFAQAGKYATQAVAVGHNADDQIETLLMHMLRGSGLSGIAGMQSRTFLKQFSPRIPLVRPLLNFWRVELEIYCRNAGLSPRFDFTNEDVGYTRNRIRKELIPILAEYNPQIKERLHGLAAAARNSLEILAEAVDSKYQDAFRSSGKGFRGFDRQFMAGLNESMRIEIIRRAAMELLPQSEDIDQAALKRAAQLALQSNKTSRTDLADEVVGLIDGDRFYITLKSSTIIDSRYPQVQPNEPIVLNIPGKVMLDAAWQLTAECMDAFGVVESDTYNTDSWNVIIDADAVTSPLSVRKRRAGDRFQPLGMVQGTISIGDLFTNSKLPSTVRPKWPLVFSGDEIIWVAALQISDKVKITPNSRRYIHLRLEKLNYDE
ncbi:MAG: tRNA lysidine(34) synthetase TilS [Bellilinea sp.]